MGIYDNLNKYTGPAILQSALNQVTANVDKREGAVIYDTLSPLAIIAAQIIQMMKTALENTDIQTAKGEWLDLVASQPPIGIYRNEATKARKLAIAEPINVQIATNTRFISNDGLGLIWRVIDVPQDITLNQGQYILECETAGAEPGGDYGELTPVEPNANLESIRFADTSPINAGMDAESDLDFRIRIWEHLKTNRYGGNFEDYMEWCLEEFPKSENGATIDGMLFFPSSRYTGGGNIMICPTAKSMTGKDYMPASNIICQALKSYLDPETGTTMGKGVSPIGHKVKVVQPTGDWLTIRIGVVLKPGYELAPYRDAAIARVEEYFAQVRSQLVSKKGDKFPDADAAGGYKATLYVDAIKGYLIPEIEAFASVQSIEYRPGTQWIPATDKTYEPTPTNCVIPCISGIGFEEA